VTAVDPEKTLAWEAKHRVRAGIAASIGAIGLLAFYISQQILQRDAPQSSGLETFQRLGRDGGIGKLPSLQIPFFEYLDTKTALVLFVGVSGMIGFLGLAWAAGFLGVVTRARTPSLRRWLIYFPIVGGAVVGLGWMLSQIGSVALTNEFLSGPRTVDAAQENANTLVVFAAILFRLGGLVLAIGLVVISLNAMRVGVLTRLFGYIGIIAGALNVICPLPVVQVFWVAGLGLLYLGRWPGGDLPAWRSGRAEPWPGTPARMPPPEKPAPAEKTVPASARRKRKKRH
jgi:hypothetical protein